MNTIDAHAHIASWPTVAESKRNLLHAMKVHYVEAALVSHADCSTYPGEHGFNAIPLSSIQGLMEVLAFAKENPGKIYAAVWIKPLVEPTPSPELLRLIDENRPLIKAIKLHPFCERIPPDDPRMEPYYELARTLELPILVHTALDPDSSIGHLVNAAKAHPDLRFVAAHLELASTHDFAVEAIKGTPNIWADTAWVDLKSAKNALMKLGKERVMFGSDAPIDGPGTLDNPLYISYFRNDIGLDEESYRMLIADNARAFYRF